MKKKGNESDFAPYLNYVYNEIPSIPTRWSLEGRTLLKLIHGSNRPDDLTEVSFIEECIEEDDSELSRKVKQMTSDEISSFETAYAISLTRSWSEKLVPCLDMFNHDSRYANVETDTEGEDDKGIPQFILLYASKDVEKGDQLFTTYRQRHQDFVYTMSEMLRDYGFIEDYPQHWTLPTPEKRSITNENNIPPEIKFVVFETETEEGEASFDVQWTSPIRPLRHTAAADYLNKELTRIKDMDASVTARAGALESEFERETILDYYRSLVIAYETVIDSIEEEMKLFSPIVESEEDRYMACADWEPLLHSEDGWEHADSTKSSFQQIDYYLNDKKRDGCLFLEEYLHACVSNRPHYHEVFVHYPAHFLDKVERVLFIGGGDSMVLHEVLKYDDQLELVVGLELDQHVVRTTYSRIGTQPHFDNEKVEWWFGDAAEALNVIPTEYYGTFDLVVVDILTEVAEALQVNDELTIMEAAMMLMNPNGIIVKNEDEGYVPGNRAFTDHTLDVVYYDVPVYCLQTFVMGSNSINFSTTKPKDHNISNFYMKGVDEFRGQFDTWYSTGKEIEDGDGEESDESQTSPRKASAMTMVIEAEEISVPLTDPKNVQTIMEKTFDIVGFKVDEFISKKSLDGYNIIASLDEGIVTARCFPEMKYCAIDVTLWKNVHMAEAVKRALLSNLESEEHSVYRVITTGMFGVEEKDAIKIGPPSKTEATSDNERNGIDTSFVRRENPDIDFKNATIEDYDQTAALKQWYSQEPVGVQSIARYEIPVAYESPDIIMKMLEETIWDALDDTLEEHKDITGEWIDMEDRIIGDGFVIFAAWAEGSAVVIWDGDKRIDVNLFSMEDMAKETLSAVAQALALYLKHTSVDVFPRGTGKVINNRLQIFDADGERYRPFWAPPVQKEETKAQEETKKDERDEL